MAPRLQIGACEPPSRVSFYRGRRPIRQQNDPC
jgi:hypothetical protein